MPEAEIIPLGPQVWLGIALLSYLLGSIPFGFLLTRFAGLGDIRAIGSGNIGATNVLRTGRKGLAAATLLLDGLKGTVAVVLASRWGAHAALLAAFCAFIGHCYPIWLKFKGGKGVATFLGVLLGLHWPTMLATAAVWIAAAAVTRYSSISALLATAAAPVVLMVSGHGEAAAVVAILTVVVWVRHRANIKRLFAGQETRIGSA